MNNPGDEVNLQNISLKDIYYVSATMALTILSLIYFDNIVKPFVVALLIWFVIKELKVKLGHISIKGRTMPHWLRGLSAFLIISLILIGISELVAMNVEEISKQAPNYGEKFDKLFNTISEAANNPVVVDYAKAAVSKVNFASIATNVLDTLSSLLSDFMIILIYVIFMLLEESTALSKLDKMFPRKDKQYYQVTDLFNKIDRAIRAYIGSMVLISLITAVVSYIALLIMGVDFPVLWAFLVFVLNFIPYIGPFISSLLPSVLAVFQFGDMWYFVYVFAVMEVIQIILGNFVQPKMMGKSLNISALTVLVALAFWGSIWGIIGMILSIPITSIMIIIMAQFPKSRFVAILLSEKGDLGD
jgi:predicted PurR-regulated permease PerM